MANDAEKKRELEAVTRRLARETGISLDQAQFLVSILRYDWPSLVREARLIAKR